MSQHEWLERGQKALIGNYAQMPLVIARGEGCYVWDSDGKRYLDLFAGFGGTILGHCHPALVAAAGEQARALWHVGNVYYNQPQIEFAERMNKTAFEGQAFFCHSGAEANEAACKLARLRGTQRSPNRYKIISLSNCFHGRTLAMLAATGDPKYLAGFGPKVEGFAQVEAGNFAELEKAADDTTAGIIMEPIQGEGGVNVYPAEYPAQVRDLCDQRGITLIYDEVWTGCGRTGKWFAHQHFTRDGGGKVEPDIMTLGKAVGGGLPVGVMYARSEVAKLIVPSTHGCTLGGNGICMAVARTIFDVIEREKLLAHATELGEWAMERFRTDKRLAGKIVDVRGRGLFLGMEFATAPDKFPYKSAERGILLNVTSGKVIRLAPPLVITREQWEPAVNSIIDLIASL